MKKQERSRVINIAEQINDLLNELLEGSKQGFVNEKDLIEGFKKDVPPIISAKGILLHLPDVVQGWEDSAKKITWRELIDEQISEEHEPEENEALAVVFEKIAKKFRAAAKGTREQMA